MPITFASLASVVNMASIVAAVDNSQALGRRAEAKVAAKPWACIHRRASSLATWGSPAVTFAWGRT